jgi:hypothetical protein
VLQRHKTTPDGSVLRIERGFWIGEMACALEYVDAEFFGDDWNILFPEDP